MNRRRWPCRAPAFGVAVAATSAGLCLAMVSLGAAESWPGERWETATPAAVEMDAAKLHQARDYALTGGGSGCIVRHGKLVLAWGDPKGLYDLKSSTKTIGVTALGLALNDGKVGLDEPAKKLHPTFGVPPEENARSGWLDKITLRMLANQTAGFDKPGGYQKLLFEPGTRWHYSDGGPNWLAECLTLVYGRDLNELMFERVFRPLGITPGDLRWRDNAYRPHELNGIKRREFGAGISANVEAMSRLGYLYLCEGTWNGVEIIPKSFVELARSTPPDLTRLRVLDPKNYGSASAHYGLLWWNNQDGKLAGVPHSAYWSWGLCDSLIVVMPTLDVVVARAGKSWRRDPAGDHYDVLKRFFEPIVAACGTKLTGSNRTPYPPSPIIKGVHWAPRETILRLARGSDNWPMTWADDDALFTAYGDGNGFAPGTARKLSLGLAKVFGTPPDIRGVNLRAASIEAIGEGQRGRKASGLLMVDGVLYLLARNVGNAQLAWSTDRGATWSWADWKFTNSFGCPTFLNFGRNYSGARDEFVYIYSQDSESAYDRADRMVLARVPKSRLRNATAYEFFVQVDAGGRAVWSKNVAGRGAVFIHRGACYRSAVSYCAPLKRYLWCQTGLGSDTRFAGGFAIYDAPEPWGPWTIACFTDEWDVGPGETSSLPVKWMSADGRSMHLVFSGDDSFSVRHATLELDENAAAPPNKSEP